MMPHKVVTLDGQVFIGPSGPMVKITTAGPYASALVDIPKPIFKSIASVAPSARVTMVARIDETTKVHIMNLKVVGSIGDDAEPKTEVNKETIIAAEVKKAAERKDTTADGIDYSQYAKTFDIVDNLAKTYSKATLFFVGKSGFGKTSMARALAEHTNRKYVRINCAAVRDPEEWFGIREARDGSTTFEPTQFSEALNYGDTVICLDEVNRLEPWLLNALFPLLDDDGATEVHGKRFEVAKNTVFVMTINVGWQYTGVFQLDEAFSNRADLVVKVGRLSITAESEVLRALGLGDADASKIVKVAMKLESVVTTDCSTRATKNVAKLVVAGMTIKEAFEAVIISRLDESETKQAWDIVNAS